MLEYGEVDAKDYIPGADVLEEEKKGAMVVGGWGFPGQ